MQLGFHKVSTLPDVLVSGHVYFVTDKKAIYVATGTAKENVFCYSGVTDDNLEDSLSSILDDVQNKINQAITGVYRVQGSVKDATELKSKESTAKKGDVWNVEAAGSLDDEDFEAGSNFVWTGDDWDKLGGTIDLSTYAKTADLKNTDKAVDNQFVTAAVQANGIVTVSRRAIEVADLPSIPVSKLSDLTNTLGGYVPTTRKVNKHALDGDVTITGADVALTGYAKGSTATAIEATDTINAAIAKLENRVGAAETGGVTEFGGKTGVITVDTEGTGNGNVKFAMSGNKLTAEVTGLGSAAYENADFLDAKIAEAKAAGTTAKNELDAYKTSNDKALADVKSTADLALQNVTKGTDGDYVATTVSGTGTSRSVGVAVTVQDIATADSTHKGLVEASDLKAYLDSNTALEWVVYNS